jgi:hypothetical protein
LKEKAFVDVNDIKEEKIINEGRKNEADEENKQEKKPKFGDLIVFKYEEGKIPMVLPITKNINDLKENNEFMDGKKNKEA